MENTIKAQTTILTGSEFRILLNSSHITYGEIHATLKEKGIFVGNSHKSTTVPILSAILLRPAEFTKLVEKSITRESRPKTKLSKLNLVSENTDWFTPLREHLFIDGFDPSSNIEPVSFLNTPNIVTHGKSKVVIPYKINRRDISQDLIKRELNFSGEIVIEKSGNTLNLDFSSTHSSPETELINNRITNRITRILNKVGATKEECLQKIIFGEFTNTERITFFKKFTSGITRTIERGSVNDMEISRDIDSPKLPDDPKISWMKQTVKRIKIDGERLNDIFLISDKKYYEYYHILRMDITYPYTVGTNTGVCRVSFAFSTPSRYKTDIDTAELSFEFTHITHNNKVNRESKKEILTKLTKSISGLIEKEYEAIVINPD